MKQVARLSMREARRGQWPPPWQQVFPALILLLAWTLFLYRETGIAMATIWARSDTFTHGFLVPPIVLWLIWRQRQLLGARPPRPAPVLLLAMAGAAFVWLLGDLVAINSVTQLALVALLVLAVPALLGLSMAHLILFPLGFLFFAVPIGEFLMPQLMEWTARITVSALRLSGIPVYREGLQFIIPSGAWSVVEACSGVRYLIASLTVGTLFAYLTYRSTRRRLAFATISILVPIVANWLRAYLIVMLGHLSGNKIAAGADHLVYGWFFFGLVIMLMFLVGARWADTAPPAPVRSADWSLSRQAPAATVWVTTACAAALVALPHVALWAMDRGEGAHAFQFTAPSTLSPNWQAVPSTVADFQPAFQNPSAEINARYVSQGQAVGLYLGYYRQQDYSRKLVSSSNVLVVSHDPQWAQVASGQRTVVLGEQSVALRTAELRGKGRAALALEERLLVWQVYWVNGRLTASDYLAKVHGAFDRLLGRGDDAAVILVYTPKGAAGDAEALLASFLTTNYPAIHGLLLEAKNGRQRAREAAAL